MKTRLDFSLDSIILRIETDSLEQGQQLAVDLKTYLQSDPRRLEEPFAAIVLGLEWFSNRGYDAKIIYKWWDLFSKLLIPIVLYGLKHGHIKQDQLYK